MKSATNCLTNWALPKDAELPPEGLTHFARRLAELGLSTAIEPIGSEMHS